MKVRKAVIPAAGLGTRFLPATKAQAKEMLPIVDKPAIQYVVEEAVRSGIEDVIIVTGRNKRAIEDHFDRSVEMEETLRAKRQDELLAEVRGIANLANIYYGRQGRPLGLGHAVRCAASFVGAEPFAVLLGDDVIDAGEPCLKQLLAVYERHQATVLGVQKVPGLHVSRYGIVAARKVGERISRVSDIVEKPDLSHAPSNMAVIGRYILTPGIFACLAETAPDRSGEVQLTDALGLLLAGEEVYAYEIDGVRYDAGDRLGHIKATIDFALKRNDVKYDLYQFMKDRTDKWYAGR